MFYLDCYSGSYDKHCRENNTNEATDLTWWSQNCTKIGEICIRTGFEPHNGTHCMDNGIPVNWYTNVTRILASEEFFK